MVVTKLIAFKKITNKIRVLNSASPSHLNYLQCTAKSMLLDIKIPKSYAVKYCIIMTSKENFLLHDLGSFTSLSAGTRSFTTQTEQNAQTRAFTLKQVKV